MQKSEGYDRGTGQEACRAGIRVEDPADLRRDSLRVGR